VFVFKAFPYESGTPSADFYLETQRHQRQFYVALSDVKTIQNLRAAEYHALDVQVVKRVFRWRSVIQVFEPTSAVSNKLTRY
jgi:hypothetical protein